MSSNGILERIDTAITNINNDEHLKIGAIFGLIIFAALIAPKLSGSILILFDNPIIKLFAFIVVAYVANKNPTVGIIMAICLIIILHTINQYKIERKINYLVNAIKKEHMQPEINEIQINDIKRIQELQQMPQMQMTPQAVRLIQAETKNVDHEECKMQYRNDNYQQFVDLEPDAYNARDNTMGTLGQDESCIDNDAFPQTGHVNSDNKYNESNFKGRISATDTTCGYASI